MKILFTLLFLFMQCLLHSQNLVPNWSFEDTTGCPTSVAQLYKTKFWFSATLGTPDYFNQCANVISQASVPQNGFGYQYARTGNAYTGILTYQGGISNHEYIEVQLTDSLRTGKKYCVSFYVNLVANAAPIDAIHAVFSNDSLLGSGLYISHVPDISNTLNNLISDTSGWTLISGQYTAIGGEKFITIGNFYSDSNTHIDSSNSIQSYYYIDDVAVWKCDTVITTENNLFVPNAFSPNGDGNNDLLFVRGQNIKDLHFSVYDRWGEKVFETNNINEGWDGTFRGEKMENAVFAYYLTLTYTDGKTEVKKGNVSLIR